MANTASQYRTLLWIFTGVGLFCFWPAFMGVQGKLDPSTGLMSAAVGVAALFMGAWYGWKGAQIRIADRNKKADAIALITIAAMLKDRSEEELTAMVAKKGPAGEAAALILERRRNGLTRASGTQATQG